MRGKFAIRDESVTLANTATTIPMTRVLENQNNFYTINADGTITVPPGTYIINAAFHGLQLANEFLYLTVSCGNNLVTHNYYWNATEQAYREISLNAKSINSMILRLYGSSSGGTCSIFGYLSATDTVLTIQKIT